MLNEGNLIHNFISSSGSGTVINYRSGSSSDFFNELRFRFHKAKSYGSYSSGSGFTTLRKMTSLMERGALHLFAP